MNKKRSSSDKTNKHRRLAEERLRKIAGSPEKFSPEDFSQIVHELQVHQIELEMQNDELRNAQEEIEVSRSKYVDLYDFAPIGYFTFDKKGLILQVNLTGAKLLGLDRGSLIKKPFSLYIQKDDQDLFFLHRKEVIETNTKHSCEIRLLKKDKRQMFIYLESCAVKGNNVKEIRSAMTDITERRIAEENIIKYRDHLEHMVTERTEEIEIQKTAVEQKNIALREIIGQIEVEKNNIKEDVSNNVNELIIPIIKNLKSEDKSDKKDINLLMQNLEKITSSFGRVISSRHLKLTPREIEISNMIEKGFTSKEIAGFLNIADKSIEWHRKNIRKKLGLSNKKINITSYLRALE